MSVSDTVTDYLAHVRAERGLSANTVAAYRRDLARYEAFLESRGIVELADVTPVEITEFVRSLSQGERRWPAVLPPCLARRGRRRWGP